MGGFTSPLADDPRVRSVRVETLSATIGDVSRKRPRTQIETLRTSIEQHGLLVPPVVMVADRQVILLSGARRVSAVGALGWHVVDAFWIGGPQELAEWLRADTAAQASYDSAAALPMSWAEIGTWYDRALKLLPRGDFTTALTENLKTTRSDVQSAAYLVRTMRDHEDERVRRYARSVLGECEAGVRKPHAATRYVKEFIAAPGGPTAKISAAEQGKMIEKLQGQTAGLITALELLIPVHDDLSEESRKAGGKALADLGRAVSRAGRALRAEKEST